MWHRDFMYYEEKYQRVGFLRHLVDKLLKGLNNRHTLLQMFPDFRYFERSKFSAVSVLIYVLAYRDDISSILVS